MKQSGEYLLLITDRYLSPLGDPIVNWATIDLTMRFNEPGSGLFTAPGHPALREQLIPGARVVVLRYGTEAEDGGQFLFAGPIEHYLYERSDDGENSGTGMVTVNFSDDLAEIAARLTYPDPALAPADQVTDAWTYTGNAETALRNLVNLNAGPGARAERVMPGLVLGSVAGVGGALTVTAQRMEPLGEVLRRTAVDGGGLGLRTRQVVIAGISYIVFEVYQPADLSGEVRFSFNLGNVKYLGYEMTAPTTTAVIVGGQGEDADRALIERSDPAAAAAWGRRETLLSRPGGADPAELAADADKQLAENAETARLQTAVAATADQLYQVHSLLGAQVAIESWPGEQLVDIVRGIHIQAWPTAGEYISPMIGSQAASSDPLWIQRLRVIDSKVSHLERAVIPAAP